MQERPWEFDLRWVAVSGGFDPIHMGHIDMFREAKKYGGKLLVILNNDNWLRAKKGFVFMDQDQRKRIIESIRYVDHVIVTDHELNDPDRTVCKALESFSPDVFVNGGDRKTYNTPEVELCKRLGIKTEFILGDRLESSSQYFKDAMAEFEKFIQNK